MTTSRPAQSIPVLMYHHITPAAGFIATTVSNFESQLAWLAQNGYQSISSAGFAAFLAGEPQPKKSILITFDDGYLDNWVYACPLLQKYGFSALVFLVTSWVGDGPVRPIMGQPGLPDTPDHAECERRIRSGEADSVMLRWSEIQAMHESGTIEFHSHTHTHTRWDKSRQATDKNTLMAQELADSRQTLLARMGQVSDHLCWPQGYFDADYQSIARQAGFKYLYTTQAFGQNTPGTDPAHIYRFAVRNTHGASLGRRIRVAAHPLIGPLFNRFKLWKRARRAKK